MNSICKYCGQEYFVRPYRQHITKYCSRSCLAKDRIDILHAQALPVIQSKKPHNFAQVEFECLSCGVKFFDSPCRKGVKKFCSQACYTISQKVPNFTKYRRLTIDGKRIQEHTWIAEQVLGRSLFQNEIVHHINGDRGDNSLGNIVVIDKTIHRRLHSTFRYHPVPLEGIYYIKLI